MKLLLASFCLNVLFVTAPLTAATLSGSVRSIVEAIPNAQVVVRSAADGNEIARLTTDSSGAYQQSFLSPGDYRLQIGAAGFTTVEVRGIHVQSESLSLPPILLTLGNQCGSTPVVHYLELLPGQSSQARISGSVADHTSRKQLQDANVTLLCQSEPECAAPPRSARGRFSWAVVPGAYKMKIRRKGYFEDEYSIFYAQAGFHTEYDPIYLDRCRGRCLPSQKPPAVCE